MINLLFSFCFFSKIALSKLIIIMNIVNVFFKKKKFKKKIVIK